MQQQRRMQLLLLLLLLLLLYSVNALASGVYVHPRLPCQLVAAQKAAAAAAAAEVSFFGFLQPWSSLSQRTISSSSSSCSSSSSSRGALQLQMASSKPRSRAPCTRPLQRVRLQQYELRVALQQKNRCLYTPLPVQQQQQQLQQRFPLSLQQMRVPLKKQKKRHKWLVEKQTKLAWRKVQHHLQQLPQLLQQQQSMLLPPEQQQTVEAAAQAHNQTIHDAVWCSFIATRVVPRLALLARQQEQQAQQQFAALQQQQQLLLNEQRHQRQQQRHEGSLLQQVLGMQRRKKASLRIDSGYAFTEQQQLHALLGLRVPVQAAEGEAAAAAAAADAAKARALALQTRQPFLQFLVDLQFVVEQQEQLLQLPPKHYCDALLQQQQQPQEALQQQDEEPPHDPTEQQQQQQQQREAALRDYLSMAAPTRGDRLSADVQAFSDLLGMAPPPVSEDARGLVATLQELHAENFTRFLARAYKFSKDWLLSGRVFLLCLARRQQRLPRRPAASAWDADTDNLEVAIDSLALLWRRPSGSGPQQQQQQQHQHQQQQQQQEMFLQELDGADLHYRQALAEPLLRAIREKAVITFGIRRTS